jgi:hypothetical protein
LAKSITEKLTVVQPVKILPEYPLLGTEEPDTPLLEVLGLIPAIMRCFFSDPPGKFREITSIRSQPLPYESFPIHHSLLYSIDEVVTHSSL